MQINQRLLLRKQLNVIASELELLELLAQQSGLSLQRIADELGISKKGADLLAIRLVERGLLVKVGGKLSVSDFCKNALCVVESTTKTQIVEQSTTPTVVESTTKSQNVVESTTAINEEINERSRKYYGVVEGTTFLEVAKEEPRAHTHVGSSNILIKNFETLKEEKIKENKINPLPPNKNKENQKEEILKRVGLVILLKKSRVRKGHRLKRMPKRKPPKILNVPFDEWWIAYDKMVGRKAAEAKWGRLTNQQRESAMQHTPKYVFYNPNKQFRQNPVTYLNQESWNNELVDRRPEFKTAFQKPTLQQNSFNALKNQFEKNGYELTEEIHPSLAEWKY